MTSIKTERSDGLYGKFGENSSCGLYLSVSVRRNLECIHFYDVHSVKYVIIITE